MMKQHRVRTDTTPTHSTLSSRGASIAPAAYGLSFIDDSTIQRKVLPVNHATLQFAGSSEVIQMMTPTGEGYYQTSRGKLYYKGEPPEGEFYKFYGSPAKRMSQLIRESDILSKSDDGGSSAAAAPSKGVAISDDTDVRTFEKQKEEPSARAMEEQRKIDHEREPGHDDQHFPELEHETFWQHDIGHTVATRLAFLRAVVAQARRIIPVAINRKQEKKKGAGSSEKDWVNDKFLCVQEIAKEFSGIMKRKGLFVDSNYIHPAALERIIMLVNSVADRLQPSQDVDKRMSGICKDFASIVFGLIVQNDPANAFKTRLGFIKDHVFVEVTIGSEHYVVDAWRTAGTPKDGVIEKSAHLDDLNSARREGAEFRELNLSDVREASTAKDNPNKNLSLEKQYEDYKGVYALWKGYEAAFRSKAERILSAPQESYVGTGQF